MPMGFGQPEMIQIPWVVLEKWEMILEVRLWQAELTFCLHLATSVAGGSCKISRKTQAYKNSSIQASNVIDILPREWIPNHNIRVFGMPTIAKLIT